MAKAKKYMLAVTYIVNGFRVTHYRVREIDTPESAVNWARNCIEQMHYKISREGPYTYQLTRIDEETLLKEGGSDESAN